MASSSQIEEFVVEHGIAIFLQPLLNYVLGSRNEKKQMAGAARLWQGHTEPQVLVGHAARGGSHDVALDGSSPGEELAEGLNAGERAHTAPRAP